MVAVGGADRALAHLDELGVETIWVADHLGSERLPPGAPWFEAWSCLTAMADETERAGSARWSAR